MIIGFAGCTKNTCPTYFNANRLNNSLKKDRVRNINKACEKFPPHKKKNKTLP